MPTIKAQFMEGGLQNGHSEQSLEKNWDAIEGNATFAFNKSHAVCYTWIACLLYTSQHLGRQLNTSSQ